MNVQYYIYYLFIASDIKLLLLIKSKVVL